MNVFPDFGGLLGIDDLTQIVGALLTFVLIVGVLVILICASVWALAASHNNPTTAAKGKTGVVVAVLGSALAGAGVAWVNWLIALGEQL